MVEVNFKLTTRFKLDTIKPQYNVLTINFGPQHPSAHGVLRLVIKLQGEYVVAIDPHIGFLHRGTEKLCESHTYYNTSVFMDRLDYTSVLTQTHAYCLAIENSVATIPNVATLQIRTIFDELSRILNHLLSLATHALDIGTMAQLFWAFEDRERIMELFEYVSGARMHVCLYFPLQNLTNLITETFLNKLYIFLKNCNKTFTEIYISLYNNRVWRLRLINVGCLNYTAALLYNVSGPLARASGLLCDERLSKNIKYGVYSLITLNQYIGYHGDSFDRFLIRMRELFESTRIIFRVLGEYTLQYNNFSGVTLRFGSDPKFKVESLINLFKLVGNNYNLITGILCGYIESGKGNFGITLITNSTNKPYRLYIRSPAYAHLQLLPIIGTGHCLADLATLLGSIDIVFGEVDR